MAEEEAEQKNQEAKSKLSSLFSNKYAVYLILVLVAAFIIRLYYFSLTKSQPLWWDEAEYALRAKAFAFGTPITGWAPEREIIVPLLFSVIFKLEFGEIGLRIFQILMSFFTVYMTYVVAKQYLDEKKALLSSFLMAFFWLHLFFSVRVLLYPWAALLMLLVSFAFYKGYIENRTKWLYVFGAVASIALQTYFSVGFLLFGILIFMFLNERFNLFKRKEIWITALIFALFLAPYAIYSQITYGFPIPRLAVGSTAITTEHGPGLTMIFGFLTMMPRLLGSITTILFALASIFFILEFVISADIILKNKNAKTMSKLYIFFAFFGILAFYTFFAIRAGSPAGEGFYDAFILSAFPFIFMFISDFIFNTKKFLEIYSKGLFTILLIFFMCLFVYYQINTADTSIKAKISSYDSVKYAGIWIKEYSNPGDTIISRSIPQNTYYSERETLNYPKTEEELDKLIAEKKPKYIVDSVWENTAQYIHEYPSKHKDKFIPIQAYFFDQQQQQVSLIIYEVKYD